jgi:hypothetical protein
MIPMKQKDIPALIVSTPGFNLAPGRGRCRIGLPLLAPPALPNVVIPRAQPAVETLALPYQPFPPSSPPRHRWRDGRFVPLFVSPPPFPSNEIGSFVP